MTKLQSLEGKKKVQDERRIFEVEEILDGKFEGGVQKYLVKWKDYPSSCNSWEPYHNLKLVREMIDDFKRMKGKFRNSSSDALNTSKSVQLSKHHCLKKRIKIRKRKLSRSLEAFDDSSSFSQLDRKESESEGACTNKFVTIKKESIYSKKEQKKKKLDKILVSLLSEIKETEEYPDNPIYVLKIDLMLNGKLSVLVRWKCNGTWSVNYENFRAKYPQLLLDYYEANLKFPLDDKGAENYYRNHQPKEILNE